MIKNFLEKNINVLEKNENVVGSIGEYKLYKRIKDPLTHEIKIKVLENTKKFQYVHPAYGDIEEKIRFYLNYNMGGPIYGVYRTDKLQKASTFERYKNSQIWMLDLAYILNVIKEGDFEVVSDTFMYKHVTEKSTSVIQYMQKQKFGLIKIVFINFPFTFWCLRNLGLKILTKHWLFFFKTNLRGESIMISELTRMIKRMIFRQEKHW